MSIVTQKGKRESLNTESRQLLLGYMTNLHESFALHLHNEKDFGGFVKSQNSFFLSVSLELSCCNLSR